MPTALLEIAREFAALQHKVLQALHATVGSVLTSNNSLNWPVQGELTIDGQRWRFRKHGLGYSIVELAGTRRHVEAHEFIDSPPFPFDAYRLSCYMVSVGYVEAENEGTVYKVDDVRSLQKGLEALRHKGALVLYEPTREWPIHSYTLNLSRLDE